MAAGEGAMPFSLESVVKDVLQQHGNGSGSGTRSPAIDLDSRRAEEAAMRRYEATDWLKKMVGMVGSKDLPTEPSEEEFRLGLRSGIILCNALNKFHHGAVQKVVENPCDSVLLPDGAVLSAYQYFENVRNFLVAVAEMGLPTFETSDLEQGGKSLRVVNCVLALKSCNERKPVGGNGASKFGGNVKTAITGKQHARKNSEPFTGSLSRTVSTNEKSMNSTCTEKYFNIMPSSSLSTLVGAVLSDKNPVEIPNLVESVLTKVMMEFEHHMKNTNSRNFDASHGNEPDLKHFEPIVQIEQKNGVVPNKDNDKLQKNKIYGKESESRSLHQQAVIDQQQRDIKVLKQMLSTTKASMQFMQRTFHEEIHNLGLHIYGVAQAASGYHRVLEENRKLYNQVQDLKGSIRVYCRVRPFQPGQHDYLSAVDHIEEESITINTLAKNTKMRKLSFNFNKVFRPSATQEEVYSDTQPLVRSVLDGYNVCIFAYGQTGSGKTYTMTGPKDLTESSQGVNYRALRDLFVLAEQRKDTFVHDVFVQMIEIYNEQVRDLLATDGLNKRLEIRNSSHTGLTVPDANLVRVSSTSDVIDLMNVGQRNRAVGATALNDRSSRSHCCLTVHVQGRDLTSGNILRGCMHLVDLAGSERIDKSEVTGDRLKEAQHINKSLSALGDVISALAQKNSHVPYRNSKLTQLLQDSLGGQAKTLMFVHISPELDAIGETISTLKFAERVATVELGAAQVNKDSTDASELKEQIANLKAALARKEEQTSIPRTASGSPCGMDLSPCQSISPNAIHRSSSTPNGLRNPMEDVGNIAACSNPESRPTRSNFKLAELLCKSPTFLPVSSPCQKNREDGRDLATGNWVDKLMVNKQDPVGVEDHLGYLNLDSHRIPEALQKILSEKPVGLFPTKTHSAAHPSKTMDEPNAETREAVLSWQFNHSSYGINHKIIKQSKIPEMRTTNAKSGAMLSERAITRDGLSRSSRWSGNPTVEEKHKARIRKQKNHLGMF